jgi:hypothetical protein
VYTCLQGTPVEIQIAVHWNLIYRSTNARRPHPPRGLCCRPAAFFRQVRLITLSFKKKKCLKILSFMVYLLKKFLNLKLPNLKLRKSGSVFACIFAYFMLISFLVLSLCFQHFECSNLSSGALNFADGYVSTLENTVVRLPKRGHSATYPDSLHCFPSHCHATLYRPHL